MIIKNKTTFKMKTKQTPEIIKPIKGFEGSYSVSNYGYVISHYAKGTSKILKPGNTAQGYTFVRLSKQKLNTNGVKGFHCIKMHRLVAEHFIQEFTKEKNCVNHKDGNRKNNHIDNLEVCSQAHNIRQAILNKQKPRMSVHCQRNLPRPVIVFDPIDNVTYTAHSMYSLAKCLGVKICAIYNACNGLQKTVKGLEIKYA